VIQALHGQQHSLAVITSNTPETVRAFLAVHELQHCFDSVTGGGTLFGKGRLIARCLAQQGLSTDQVLYIGDEVRDVEAARFAGIKAVSVTWGFNSRDALAAAQPDWLVDDPKILQAIADTI
jgi:phosphoglycolate phosphatase-like HAD superfamily hydrolase